MKANRITGIAVALALACAGSAMAAAELSPSLVTYLARTAPTEFVPVTVVCNGGMAPEALADMTAGLSRDAARSLMSTLVKEKAAESQREVLMVLKKAEAAGAARNVRSLWAPNAVAAEVKPGVLVKVAGLENVRRLNLDAEYEVICGLAWGVDKIDAERCWNELSVDGTGVVVAVTDTGVDYLHTDLVGQSWVNTGEIPDNNIDDDNNGYVDDYHGWNFYDNSKNTRGGDSGHGSHCAGTVCGDGTAGTQTGVAPGAHVMPVQVLSNSGSGSESDVWDGMDYAADMGADAISMSLGWRHIWNPDRATWRSTCETLIAGGMVLNIAAGNERQDQPGAPDNIRTPGDVPAVITVAATDADDNYAYFSSFGPVSWTGVLPWNDYPYPPGLTKPDVAAPGLNITSTRGISGGYTVMSGTSMATPHVAGFSALILEVSPNLTNAQVRQWMEDYALDRGPSGKDNDYGSGRIQCYETIHAMQLTPVELKSLTARAAKDRIQVRWVTGTEERLAGFNLYRRKVAEGGPAAAGANELASYARLNADLIKGRSPYSFDDADVDAGATYEYLLQDVDLLGRTTEHGPVEARAGGGVVPSSYWLAQTSPNPTRGAANVRFGLPAGFSGRAVLEVFDLSGRRVDTPLDRNLTEGEYEVAINAAALAPGVYVYRLSAGEHSSAKRMVVAR